MGIKKTLITIGVIIVGGMLIIAGISGLYTLFQPEEGTIVGKAYLDTNGNSALDYGDVRAVGLKVQLRSTITDEAIDEVTVDANGEYRFDINQGGEYWIDIVCYSGIYELPYPYNATSFFGDNPIKVERGDIIVGPTILLVGGMG